MAEDRYMNREIDEKFSDIKESLDRIEAQTTKTNGRVSSLEMWRYFVTGAIAVLTAVVVPILAWALWVLVNIDGQINQAVGNALQAYDIKKVE